jgi:hypothetical protein
MDFLTGLILFALIAYSLLITAFSYMLSKENSDYARRLGRE